MFASCSSLSRTCMTMHGSENVQYATNMSQTLLSSAETFRLLSIRKRGRRFSVFVSYTYRVVM